MMCFEFVFTDIIPTPFFHAIQLYILNGGMSCCFFGLTFLNLGILKKYLENCK